MWFKILSLLITLLCFAKAASALLAPQLFYRPRRQQYASPTIPVSVFLPPLGIVSMTLVAWYATFLHYQSWSWIVTGFLSVVSLLAAVNLFRWSQHRVALLHAIGEEQAEYRRQVDVGILMFGAGFALLGVVVF